MLSSINNINTSRKIRIQLGLIRPFDSVSADDASEKSVAIVAATMIINAIRMITTFLDLLWLTVGVLGELEGYEEIVAVGNGGPICAFTAFVDCALKD